MSTQPQPAGPLVGSAVFVVVTITVAVAGLNLTALAAALHPLLGVATLLVAVLVLLSVADRIAERWVPTALRAFGSWCRGTVHYLRGDR